MGEDLTVVRWRRYGNDRLYVNDATGRRVGWIDLVTDQTTRYGVSRCGAATSTTS